MKKNKPVTIALLIAVLVIWGTIAYKIVQATNTGVTKIPPIPTRATNTTDQVSENYEIAEYTRDPFLSIITDTATVPEVVQPTTPTPEKKPIVIPEYYGVVQNEKEKTALLKIKGKLQFLHTGEMNGDVKVVSIYEDKVVLLVEGQRVTADIRKKQLQKIFETEKTSAK